MIPFFIYSLAIKYYMKLFKLEIENPNMTFINKIYSKLIKGNNNTLNNGI